MTALALLGQLLPEGAVPGPLPEDHAHILADKLAAGQLVLFVGAGLSHQAIANDGRRLPLWKELAEQVATKYHKDLDTYAGNILDLFDGIRYGEGPFALENEVLKALDDKAFELSPAHKMLATLPWVGIYTTNYDRLLERALDEKPVFEEEQYDRLQASPERLPKLFKIHGTLDKPHTLTREDYRLWAEKHPRAYQDLEQVVLNKTVLFVGYSLSDPDLVDGILPIVKKITGDRHKRLYAWMWHVPSGQVDLLDRRDKIGAVSINLHEDWAAAFAQVKAALEEIKRNSTPTTGQETVSRAVPKNTQSRKGIEATGRESWESYGWLFNVTGYRLAYIPILGKWDMDYTTFRFEDIKIGFDSVGYKLPKEFIRKKQLFKNFKNRKSCRLSAYIATARQLSVTFSETRYGDYLLSGEHLDDPMPDDPSITFREQFGTLVTDHGNNLRVFDRLTNICGVGVFIVTNDGYVILSHHSDKAHVYPGRLTYSASGTMKWGVYPHPFTEAIRKSDNELGHLINPTKLSLVGFGVDARKLYFQFSFVERADASCKEVLQCLPRRERKRIGTAFLSEEDVVKNIFRGQWEPAAEATLLSLCKDQPGWKVNVESALQRRKDKWSAKAMRDEWDYRASRPGLLPDMSVRYPVNELGSLFTGYVERVKEFTKDELHGKTVVEVGCGTGRITKYLMEQAERLTCIDICDRMIQKNKEYTENNNIRYIAGFAQDELCNLKFHTCICSRVLIHNFEEEDFLNLVKAICLACDTIFIFEDVTKGRKTSPHTKLRSENELVEAFRKHGFMTQRRGEFSLFKDDIIALKLSR